MPCGYFRTFGADFGAFWGFDIMMRYLGERNCPVVDADWLSDDKPVDRPQFVILQQRADAVVCEEEGPRSLDTPQPPGLTEEEVEGGGDGFVVDVDGWEVLD